MRFPLDGDVEVPWGRQFPGGFGAQRKHDIHTGVDLYTSEGSLVYALEPGVVVVVEDFTGPKAGSPWWLETMALLVEGERGVICYGEIVTNHAVGDLIHEGMIIGEVRRVLRNDKGLPTAMLHFELYDKGTRKSVVWGLDEPWPKDCEIQRIFCLKRRV